MRFTIFLACTQYRLTYELVRVLLKKFVIESIVIKGPDQRLMIIGIHSSI